MGGSHSRDYDEVSHGAPKEQLTQEEPDEVDCASCVAECCGVSLLMCALLLLYAGLALNFLVKPPGEKDLCTVECLGLQNETAYHQNQTLGSCHLLYTSVFSSLSLLSLPLLIVGLLALLAAASTLAGACSKIEERALGCYAHSARTNVIGTLLAAVVAPGFCTMSATVTVLMAPINAYYLTMEIGRLGVTVVNYTSGQGDNNSYDDEGVRQAAYTYNTLYLGYCACAKVEQCLLIGSSILCLLVVVFPLEVARAWVQRADTCDACCFGLGGSISRRLCGRCRPKYGNLRPGSHLCHWWRKQRKRWRKEPHSDNEYPDVPAAVRN